MRFNIFNLFKKPTPQALSSVGDFEPVPNVEVKLEPLQTDETTKLRSIIESIILKHKAKGIAVNKPAKATEIAQFEQQIGFTLPADFKEFYSICNGFGCNEDIFNMTPIENISNCDKEDDPQGFYFAEYMIYSDSWGLRRTAPGKFEIFNGSYPLIPMTSSLEEFLNRFLKGDVFEEGGLYRRHEELGIV